MLIRTIIPEATQIWSKSGSKNVRKYRCTSGIRKGRIMASPASCNKPMNAKKSASFKKTRSKKGVHQNYRASLSKRSNPAAIRVKSLNKSSQKTRPRTSSSKRARRIK